MRSYIKSAVLLVAALPVLPLLTGCLATYAVQEQQTAHKEDLAILQERVRRVEGRLEGYELAIQQLQRAVEQMRAQPSPPSQADVQALQTRLATLDNQLRALDTARQKDRQEIVDSLSTKIASLVSSANTPRGSGAKPAASQGRRSATQEGYEHVVEAGQTLSAIAAAYNVRTKDIVDANNITDPTRIRVGQKLFIPAP